MDPEALPLRSSSICTQMLRSEGVHRVQLSLLSERVHKMQVSVLSEQGTQRGAKKGVVERSEAGLEGLGTQREGG